MTIPALALAPVLTDPTGATVRIRPLDIQLLERAARDDYDRWRSTALQAGGCVQPIRLSGTVTDIDATTGEILHGLDTEGLPDKVIYVPCGDRRESVCPPCAETYRADTYQLIRAGLAGGKGVPESVSAHPCVFATFTAPSFGPVHTRVVMPGGKVARCRPRRKAYYCPHGRRLSCGQRHSDGDACLGKPLCLDCYDYNSAVVWNAHAPELWRRTVIAIRRRLAKLAREHGARVEVSYAKVAEFQRRGVVHFHAIFRLDGLDPHHPERTIPPHPALTAGVLADAIRQAASATWFATVSHPAKPKGWDITWGTQIDPRIVRLTGDGEISDTIALRCTKAGVRYIRVHDTRRTCASLLVALNVHPRVAMQILRHSQIAVTMQVYSEVPSEATQDALRRLGQSLDRPTATAAPVAAQRSLKAGRDSQPASDLVGDTGIEPVTSSV